MSPAELRASYTRAAIELTSPEAPRWEFVAARLLAADFAAELEREQGERGLKGFVDKVHYLVGEGLYGSYIVEGYSDAELAEAASFIDPSRDALFFYLLSGLDLCFVAISSVTRASAPREPAGDVLGIALHLTLKEPAEVRLESVRRFYDMLSRLEVTMATPTMSNARKPHHQLSSCFIDTVPDSLEGVYRSVDNSAQVSKFGGGMGMYLGHVRAAGGSIRGFEGAPAASSGGSASSTTPPSPSTSSVCGRAPWRSISMRGTATCRVPAAEDQQRR